VTQVDGRTRQGIRWAKGDGKSGTGRGLGIARIGVRGSRITDRLIHSGLEHKIGAKQKRITRTWIWMIRELSGWPA